MSDVEATESVELPEKVGGSELGRLIAAGIAEGIAATAPVRKVTVGQYIKKPHSSFHPTKANYTKLTRETYQNGRILNDARLTDVEIGLLNKISRPGRYLKRKVEVVIRNTGGDLQDEVVEIRYRDRTKDQMLMNTKLFSDAEDLFRKIVMEQEVALENEKPARPSKA